jgi:hypothetical protein
LPPIQQLFVHITTLEHLQWGAYAHAPGNKYRSFFFIPGHFDRVNAKLRAYTTLDPYMAAYIANFFIVNYKPKRFYKATLTA